MILSKKERRIVIAVGITIGVACSSMMVRYAMKQKIVRTENRPGNYQSGRNAQDKSKFPPLPQEVTKSIRNGVVVYFDYNQSVGNPVLRSCRSWVLETTGSFRSERLFILVEKSIDPGNPVHYYRATELYLSIMKGKTEEEITAKLDPGAYRIIGKNRKTNELILQIKHFSPSEIKKTMKDLPTKIPSIKSIRLVRWFPVK